MDEKDFEQMTNKIKVLVGELLQASDSDALNLPIPDKVRLRAEAVLLALLVDIDDQIRQLRKEFGVSLVA